MKRLKNAFVLLLLLHLGCERHQEQHEQKGEVASDTTVHYSAPTDFYSINDGNQRKPMFAPSYNKAWFDSLEKVYSWEYFDKYNNRFYAYMTKLFDALPALSKGLKSSKEISLMH